jgi:hypothetical protein
MRERILDLLGIAHPKVSLMSIASNDIGNRCAEITAPDNRYLHIFLWLSERKTNLYIVHTNTRYR